MHKGKLTNINPPRITTEPDLEIFRVKTYRYIYPLCRKFKFCKEPQPYPAYDKGEEPIEWKRDTSKIKSNIIRLLDNVAA